MEDELLKEHGIDLAIELITIKISKKMDEYKQNKDKEIEKELATLLNDKEKIYLGDMETIKKYVKMNNGGC